MDRATLSHTGALAGKYELYKTAFHQAGMIVVDDMTELIDTVKALAFQPAAGGDRVAIFSVQAGPGIIMADKCHELGQTGVNRINPAPKPSLQQVAHAHKTHLLRVS
ncbi:unnamed protein product [marine sediment metagenome]|uniref:Succinyl-CoA synthetase-like flavodoxin domain-containing protein n=1 Tax=marine sediment metagenome TaxID=412755 RepID=X1MTA7_9ZZZZ